MINKVLILTPGFPENELDTTCVPYLQDYILALADAIGNENIKVITIQYPFTQEVYLWNGIEVFPSGGRNKKSFTYYFTLRRTNKRVAQLFKKNKYIIHAFWMGEAAFIGRYAAKKYATRFVVTFMGQDVKPGNRVMCYIDQSTTNFVAVSSNQDKHLLANYGFNADAVIPFPIPEFAIEHDLHRAVDLLFVGSLIDVKQPIRFVNIVAEVAKKFPEVKAVIAGDGVDRDKVLQQIELLNLRSNIKFVGQKSRPEILDLMAHAKILVHTSIFEGQCLVYAEALASGMYVVSYNVGRIDETDRHFIGESEQDLVKQVLTLLSQDLTFVATRFINTSAVVDAYQRIYKGE
jgi:glycosyltransferase involved in cell wall biosynthesis